MPTQMPRNGRAFSWTASFSADFEPGDRVQALAAIRERAHTGQHDAVGSADVVGRRGDGDRRVKAGVGSGALEGFQDRTQISRTAVDNGDPHYAGPGCGPAAAGSDWPRAK